jgi:glutathione S-transferase
LLQQSATGPYFLGEEFSLADVSLAPFIQRIHGFNVIVLDGYMFEAIKNSPRLAEFIKGILSRPTVQETYCGDEKYTSVLVERFGFSKQ